MEKTLEFHLLIAISRCFFYLLDYPIRVNPYFYRMPLLHFVEIPRTMEHLMSETDSTNMHLRTARACGSRTPAWLTHDNLTHNQTVHYFSDSIFIITTITGTALTYFHLSVTKTSLMKTRVHWPTWFLLSLKSGPSRRTRI